MDTQVQETFIKFKAAMEAAPFDLPDMLDLVDGFLLSGQVSVARSINGHARDYLLELRRTATESVGYGQLLAEAYRRTFCDPKTASKYGTEGLANSPAQVVGLLTHTLDGLVQFTQTDNPEQLALALEADTTRAH